MFRAELRPWAHLSTDLGLGDTSEGIKIRSQEERVYHLGYLSALALSVGWVLSQIL